MAPPAHGRAAIAACALAVAGAGTLALTAATDPPTAPAVRPAATSTQAGLPTVFEPNAGRTDPSVRFLARGPGYRLLLGERDTRVVLDGGAVVSSRLAGARRAPIAGSRRVPGKLNSYVGKDRSRWVTGAPLYGSVVQRGVYPGIDLVHRGSDGSLEYDFEVAPGADPGRIAIDVAGALARLDLAGDLRLDTPAGALVQRKPVAYQGDGAQRVPVDAEFSLQGNRVSFDVGAYDRTRPLVIDPVLSYSTYLGGTSSQVGNAIAVGEDRSAYVAGMTSGADFPQAEPGEYGGGAQDGFVVKLAPGGGSVGYVTYFGGDGYDQVKGIDVDSSGNAFIAGQTSSTDLPVPGGLYTSPQGGIDAFVAKLGATGGVSWSTYLGGDGEDQAAALQLSEDGAPAVVGHTKPSTTEAFPTEGTSADTDYNGGDADAFVTTFAADGSALGISTFLGGTGDDRATALTEGSNPLVAGTTLSADFPTTAGVPQEDLAGGSDMFIASLDGVTGAVSAASYIGGTGFEEATSVTVTRPDPAIDVWVGGHTTSNDVMGQSGNHGGGADGVAVKVEDATPPHKVVYFGGTDFDLLNAAAPDAVGNVIFAGSSQSASFSVGATALTSLNPIDSTPSDFIGWLAKLDGADDTPLFATYLGGAFSDHALALDTDDGTGMYLTGGAGSDDFPLATPVQSELGGTADAFATRIGMAKTTVDGPGAIIKSTTAQFDIANPEPGATFECRLTPPGVIEACGVQKTYNSLADGQYTFGARATDTTGNTDGFAPYNFIVDTTAPAEFALREPADGALTSTTPTFSWDAATDVNKVTTYQLEIDGTVQQEVQADSACADGVCTAASSPLVTGARTWRVIAIDSAGNTRASASRTFTAQEPPAARFTMAPNPALVGRAVTFDGSGSVDAAHTIGRYEWDLDGDGSFETDGGATPTASRAYTSPQTVNVGLRVTDSTGLTGESRQELRVTIQTVTGQFGVSINRGAQYTRSPDVTVTAVFPASITSMLFSNDGGFFAPTTFKPAATTKWKLDSSGPERLPKIVYVRFLTGPLVSETHTDDIILDETPPKVTAATLLGGARTASVAARRTYRLRLRASDSNSGVRGVQITANKRKPGRLLRYRRKMTVKATVRPRFVRARDRAGNNSRWRKLR